MKRRIYEKNLCKKDELLPPQKLETLFIDIKNKTFLLNGKEFGKKCNRISIVCCPPEWQVKVIIDQPIEFTNTYNQNGEKGSNLLNEIISVK
mgnify:CR=1 FL=1